MKGSEILEKIIKAFRSVGASEPDASQNLIFFDTGWLDEQELAIALENEFSSEIKKSTYEICQERGHASSGQILTSIPPWNVCKFCGTYYRKESGVEIESNIPK